MTEPNDQVVLSDEEAEELYRFTKNDYINRNNYPALMRLLVRVEKRVRWSTTGVSR
jgi:hypothetical protein